MKSRWSIVSVGWVILSLVVSSLVIAPAFGASGVGRGGFRSGGYRSLDKLLPGLSQIDLTDEQQEQVDAIQDAFGETREALRDERFAVREALVDVLVSPDEVTEADLAPFADQIAALQQQVVAAKLSTALALRAVLTPEQLAQLNP